MVKIGDVVRVKTNGGPIISPIMCVEKTNLVLCVYYIDNVRIDCCVHEECLEHSVYHRAELDKELHRLMDVPKEIKTHG